MKYILRFWCITILCLIFLPCVFSRKHGIANLPFIYPEGVIRVPYGQPLEIFCKDQKYMASDLEFALSAANSSLRWEQVNATTIVLYTELHNKGLFSYYCRNKVTNKICPSRVLVDSPPAEVTDFACKSKNLEVLNCTWTNPDGFSVTNYTLILKIENSQNVNECTPKKSGRTRYCSWNTINVPRYRQETKQFFFTLQFCNVFGCNKQNFTVDHVTIIKPDPPSHLEVIDNGTHNVLLQWRIPNNMYDFLLNGVDHKIEYQIAKIDNTSYFRKVNTSGLPAKNLTYKFLLSDLPYAHMQYEVRIYIRPKEAVKEEFWSDFTYLVFYTASEKPKRPPDTVVGAFDQSPFQSKRRINVYWKQLEAYEEAGANFTYKVVVHQGTGNSKTLLADTKKSSSFVVLEDASLGAINVEIMSTNDNGSSHNSSHLYIPSYTDTVDLKVSSLTKQAHENGTYKLSWFGINNIDNYTVFWCQDNTTPICAGRMNFTVLEPNKTNYVIDLPRENRYQFAISANNGTKSSGMVWTTCDISKDDIRFPVKLSHGVPGKSFVKITWTMACSLQEDTITGYLITYCPVKDTNVCDTSFDESTVNISDSKQMETNITDLNPFKTYQFVLALNTIYGLKTIEHAFIQITTTEDTPTSPRSVSITKVESDYIILSWDPPLHKTGVIGKYVIYNFIQEYTFDTVSNKDMDSVRRSFKLEGLDGFSNYSWSVAACNLGIRSCSEKSPPNGIFIRTRIGYPSQLKSPTIFNSPNVIKWEEPKNPGGAVDFYQILRVKNDQIGEIFNTTNLSYSLSDCEEGLAVEKYSVRAVNLDKDPYHGLLTDRMEDIPNLKHTDLLLYPGQWSNPITVHCRSKEDFSIVTYICVAAFALAVFVVILYELVKFYSR